jgi:hypothetical protein
MERSTRPCNEAEAERRKETVIEEKNPEIQGLTIPCR